MHLFYKSLSLGMGGLDLGVIVPGNKVWLLFYSFFFFETGSYIDQAGLELTTFFPQSANCLSAS
jgi:hypothetical protein